MAERSSFEDAIIAAIADQFFATHPMSVDPNSGYTNYSATPALNLAWVLFDRNKDAIFEAVAEKLDIDDLSTRIAAKVVQDLEIKQWGGSYQGDEFRKDLRTAVIDKMAAIKAEELRVELEAKDASANCPECGSDRLIHLDGCTYRE